MIDGPSGPGSGTRSRPFLLLSFSMGGVYSKFGIDVPFDPGHSLVTSPVYTPLLLACFRLLFGFYYLVCFIVKFSWDSVNSPVDNEQSARIQPLVSPSLTRLPLRYFSFFTHLSEIGLCAYFWSAGVQTFVYARWDKYPLRHWPRFLQFLHLWLCSTVITFRAFAPSVRVRQPC